MNKFQASLGDLETFLKEIPVLANEFAKALGIDHVELRHIRGAVEQRNFEITNDPHFVRTVFGAFCALLIDWYAKSIRLGGIFRKVLFVESKGFKCELTDLFYRCVFEGVDLAPEGEGLPKAR